MTPGWKRKITYIILFGFLGLAIGNFWLFQTLLIWGPVHFNCFEFILNLHNIMSTLIDHQWNRVSTFFVLLALLRHRLPFDHAQTGMAFWIIVPRARAQFTSFLTETSLVAGSGLGASCIGSRFRTSFQMGKRVVHAAQTTYALTKRD